jgi:hypothetical protein
MASSFHYLVGQTTWGIAIFLTAEARYFAGNPGSAREAASDIWLVVEDPQLTPDEHEFLLVGLRLVSKNIRQHSSIKLPVAVHVLSIEFSLCDYQPEGLAGAMVGWASQEFGFPELEIPVDFDRSGNRYVFHFPQG